MRPAPVVLALTLLATGALHAIGALVEPPEVPLADLPRREGARVVVAGEVERARATSWGGTFDLSDGVRRVPVLTDGTLPERGAWVRVEGVVVSWRGALAVDAARVVAGAPVP